jgi:hypothetical protein
MAVGLSADDVREIVTPSATCAASGTLGVDDMAKAECEGGLFQQQDKYYVIGHRRGAGVG